MGITDFPILDLIPKVGSWISSLSASLSPESSPMSCCYECRAPFPVSGQGFRCRSCGRLFCRKCMTVVSRSDDGGQPKFCHFCFHAITGSHLEASEGREPLMDSPLLRFRMKLAHLAESQQFASPRSLGCSTCRSDEEDDADNSRKNHFFSPSSELYQDVSDVDSISISTGHELYSFKSVNSSPFDSPSRVGESGDNSPGLLDQEASGYFRKSGAEANDLLESKIDSGYDNLSVYHTSEIQKAQPPLDFENNWQIWEPPPPEDENDDVETGLFGFADEDDDVGGSGMAFSSGSFSSDAFTIREKPSDAHKEHLRDAVRVHFRALVSQLLKGEGIPVGSDNGGEGWLEIVSLLAWQAATFVKPDTSKGGSMDPGDYVKVKCIFSGRPSDSTLVKGVVCTKNVKHKRMVSQHKNPRLFLLGGALEYQKVPNKLASINTVLEQEIDHLKMSVAKIEAHRPNVLLVEKSVSSYAQEYLLTNEISLVLNVKRKLLERISRCTGAQIAPSIDNIASARLGHCEMFRVEKISEQCSSGNHLNKKSIKSFMFFEGCPRRLGCTVLLRGAHSEELKKVKHVVQFASFAAYHLSRETSFLADEGATLPKISLIPQMAIPAITMNADTCISKTSASTIPNIHQTVTGEHEILEVNSEEEECTSKFKLFISGDISCLSPSDYQPNGDFATESTSVLSLCGSGSSRSVFQCKEPCAPSHSPTDVRISQGEVLNSSFNAERSLSNHIHLSEANEKTDIDDGNDVPSEYLTADNHQSILVSLSSTCVIKGTVCEREHPRIFRIKFYGSFDKPIGRYLREDLFDQSCNEPAEAHVRCYTHQHGSLTISVKRLPYVKLPGERDGRIWMWHRCLKCEPKDGVPPASRRVVMSDAAWALSFGKFLDLSFSNHAMANRVASCGHSIQKDCLRFYGFGSMVAFFRYSPIDILSVQLPPLVLDFACQIHQDWARREAEAISSKMEFLHSEVFDVLHGIEQKITSEYEPIKTSIHKYIMELKDLLKRESNDYYVLLKSAAADSSPPSQAAVDIFELNRLRRSLLIDSYTWDRRLCLLDSFSKSRSCTSKLYPQVPEVISYTNLKEWRAETLCKDAGLGNSSEETITKSSTLSKQHEEVSLQVLECISSNLVEMGLSIESVEGYVGSAGFNLVLGQRYRVDERQTGVEACTEDESSLLENLPSPASNLSEKIDLAWTGNPEANSEGSLSLMDTPIYRKMMSPVRVNSFDSALRFRDRIHGRPSPASLHLSSVRSFDASRVFGTVVKDPIPYSPLAYSQRSPRSVKRLSYLPSHSPVFISSASHMVREGARLLLPQTGLDNIVTVLYDNEPTTIISHAISSQEHADFITCKLDQHEGLSENEKISGTGRPSVSQFQSDADPQLLRGSPAVDSKESHFRISFEDESSIPADRVKFSVTCYFAKQFDALRKKCCPNEVDFLRSLNRCNRWNAQGGKSNVYFAKSFDGRFIIKQVTRTELDSFEDFAPVYFNHLTESIYSGSPTCLAKVFGIYQVTVKHLKGGREVKMDLMVMENLFFGRNVSSVYDLKGSCRARYNPDTSGNNNVLLDLNLLEALRTKPIFLASKAKRRLDRAIWNDTSFLASIGVMDYSLLVGVDEDRKELVVGIIDFMRQYTWDKHLETWVKASGILGGPKNASPTVISPLQYKKRFRKAMSKYFLTVPDNWSSS